ncbi:acyl-CoA reductase-like NAD-dependent aldehyde dehydrogenase [Streptomyces aurantiacus]|nr:acyl-CoA reductase-like NAD-dependent aldehyde dehydrogenase [Streptomyces aurantiacus]
MEIVPGGVRALGREGFPGRGALGDDLTFALLAEAVATAGIPAGVINVLTNGSGLGAYLVSHPDIDKISFTGSTEVGREIAGRAGRLLRPVTLELGGKSAALILDDADLAPLTDALFFAFLLNNGQTCFASTRILAPRSRYDEVVGFYEALAKGAVVGDALDPGTQIGPMVSARHRSTVERYIQRGVADGAKLVTGGGRPKSEAGWFVTPTVFADVDNSLAIAREEIFGPVLSIIAYDGDDEAIRIANDSEYGLGGTVWTSDSERGQRVARQVQTGTIGINHYPTDLGAPYGGVKGSVSGGELQAVYDAEDLREVAARAGRIGERELDPLVRADHEDGPYCRGVGGLGVDHPVRLGDLAVLVRDHGEVDGVPLRLGDVVGPGPGVALTADRDGRHLGVAPTRR